MKKNNNKGFMMLETLVVSVFVITILTYLYIQFINLKSNYSVSFKYDTINDLYKSQEIDEYISTNVGYKKLITSNDMEIYFNNKCNLSYFSSTQDYCNELMDKLEVTTSLLIKPTTDIDGINDKYGKELKKYIKAIAGNNTNNYYIITEFEDETFSSIIVYEGDSYANFKCVAATSLHSNYGKIPVHGKLRKGDAFDCDVNGDGLYNSDNERFYFLSTLDSDSEYAVLIYSGYYKTGVRYRVGGINYGGPISAVNSLPTTSEWSNVRLHSESGYESEGSEKPVPTELNYTDLSYPTRAIIGYSPGQIANMYVNPTTTISGHALPTHFVYKYGYPNPYVKEAAAARLATYEELAGAVSASPGNKFYQENAAGGYWLENPDASTTDKALFVTAASSPIISSSSTNTELSIKPVIEVKKSEIEY